MFWRMISGAVVFLILGAHVTAKREHTVFEGTRRRSLTISRANP